MENAPLKIRIAELYELIWKRTIASQMAVQNWNRQLRKYNFLLNEELTPQGEVWSLWFFEVYMEDRDEEDMSEDEHQEGMLLH